MCTSCKSFECKACEPDGKCTLCPGSKYIIYYKNSTYGNCSLCNLIDEEYVDEANNKLDGTGLCLRKKDCEIKDCEKCSDLYRSCAKCVGGMYLTQTPERDRFYCSFCDKPDYYVIPGKKLLN
jgi:hypothetical protein